MTRMTRRPITTFHWLDPTPMPHHDSSHISHMNIGINRCCVHNSGTSRTWNPLRDSISAAISWQQPTEWLWSSNEDVGACEVCFLIFSSLNVYWSLDIFSTIRYSLTMTSYDDHQLRWRRRLSCSETGTIPIPPHLASSTWHWSQSPTHSRFIHVNGHGCSRWSPIGCHLHIWEGNFCTATGMTIPPNRVMTMMTWGAGTLRKGSK